MSQADELYDQLMRTCLLLGDGDRQFFSHYQLTPARFYAMKHIRANSGLSLSELSSRLLCTKGNATRILRAMENDGLLTRSADPADQRAYRLELTTFGLTKFEAVFSAYQRYNQLRFGNHVSQSIEDMVITLREINQNLQTQLQEPNHPDEI